MRWLVYRTFNGAREQSVQLYTFKPPDKDLNEMPIHYDQIVEVDDTTDFQTLRLFHSLGSLEGDVEL